MAGRTVSKKVQSRMVDIECPLTKVKDEGEEASAEEETEHHGSKNVAVLEHSRRQCSLVSFPELDTNKHKDHEAKANKQANNLGVAPSILRATPLQGQDETHNGGDEDGRAEEIDFENTLQDSHAQSGVRVAVDVQQEDDNEHGEAADGEVDVETPSPGDLLGEDTAEERTGDGGDSPHATDEAKGNGTPLEGHYRSN